MFHLEKIVISFMGEVFILQNFCPKVVNDYIEPMAIFTTWAKNFIPLNISVMQAAMIAGLGEIFVQ